MIQFKTRAELPHLFEAYNVLGIGAEIGVQFGTFSRTILSGYSGRLILVDNWKAEGLRQALQLLDDEPRVIMRRLDSLEAAETTQDESLDFVYMPNSFWRFSSFLAS